MKKKRKVKMKYVRVDHKTVIQVPASVPDNLAINTFNKRRAESQKTISSYGAKKSHANFGAMKGK